MKFKCGDGKKEIEKKQKIKKQQIYIFSTKN